MMLSKKRKIAVDEESKPIESIKYNVCFQHVYIPVEIVRLIMKNLKSNFCLLNSFGMVNKSLYFQTRLNWSGVVKVTENNVNKIPIVVLKGLSKLWFCSRVAFKKIDFVRIVSNINPLKLRYLSFEALQVTKSSSRNEFYLLVIKKLNLVFPNCQHLTVCYGVRENNTSIRWDFSTNFPNITTIESPARINSSLISQLPNVERILHGMKRSEVLSFLEMMKSEYVEICNQVKYFHKTCDRETRTAFEVSRYGRESPYKQVWGARQLKEPEIFPPYLEKTVKLFKNMERMDLNYSKNVTYWEREGLQNGGKLDYKIDVLCISSLSNLKILNFRTKYEQQIIKCNILFPHDLRDVKSMELTTIPYTLFFDHLSQHLRAGKWKSLENLRISFNRRDNVDFFEIARKTDGMTGEEYSVPTKLSEKGRGRIDELMTKKDFPVALKYMKISFSSHLTLVFFKIKDDDDNNIRIFNGDTKNVRILLYRWDQIKKEEEEEEVFLFNQFTTNRNLKDESNKSIVLEMDTIMSSVLDKIPPFVVVVQRRSEN